MTVEELQARVRGGAPSSAQVELTDDGAIVSHETRAIQFWVSGAEGGGSFSYTRTIKGKGDGLGELQSDDVADVLLYL